MPSVVVFFASGECFTPVVATPKSVVVFFTSVIAEIFWIIMHAVI